MSGLHLASSRRFWQVLLLAPVIVACLGSSDDSARFGALGHKLMCVCGCNQVLLECNHVGCTYSDRMRDELAANLSRGDSDDLILQAFVQKYGSPVLIVPTMTGFNRVAWVVPYLVLLAGLGIVVFLARAWKMRPIPASGTTTNLSGAESDVLRDQARRDTAV
jgi:cytochrome c-type biogenesis protein CcmH/NrfF